MSITAAQIKNDILPLNVSVLAKIKGNLLKDAKIIREGSQYYLCQNEYNGSRPSDTLGFKYGWSFSLISQFPVAQEDGFVKFDSEVSISLDAFTNPVSTLVYNTNGVFYLKMKMVKDKQTGAYIKKTLRDFYLFTRKDHFDCCGCELVYGFDTSDEQMEAYSRYNVLSKEDISAIKSNLFIQNKASKLAHLSEKQISAIKFVESLGFKRISQYTNPKTSNIIYIYNINYLDEKN